MRARRPAFAVTLFLVVTGAVRPALASDWLLVSGTEEGRPDAVVPFGFAQLLVESSPWKAPVPTLTSDALRPFSGQLLAAEVAEPVEVTLRRFRAGARGSVPGTGRRLSFTAALEAGQNSNTRGRGVTLLDASVTATVMPGLRLRVGQFKVPTADEALESNATAAAFTRFSPFVSALLIEQHVVDGALPGPADGFRDVGVQAFDALPLWQDGGRALDASFAAMVSLGRPIHALDDGAAAVEQLAHVLAFGPDLTARVQLSYLLDVAQRARGDRDELSAWVWRSQGARIVDGAADVAAHVAPRIRQGLGGQLRKDGVRVRGELVAADGVLASTGAFVGQPATLSANATAWGGSVDLEVARVAGVALDPFIVDVGADWLARNADDPAAARWLSTGTLGVQVRLSRWVRLLANAELRRQVAGPQAHPDATITGAALSPLVSTQLNLVW